MTFQRRRFGGNHQQNNRGNRGFGGSQKIRYMNVDPRMLIKKASPRQEEDGKVVHTIDDLALTDQIKRNVKERGYKQLTPIQDRAIPEILRGRDVIGLASTGTGKTAAFLLPLIDKVQNYQGEKVLIITPTRELAVQICEEGRRFARNTGCNFALVIGGVGIGSQINNLRRNPQIVVGTPGRIKDLYERGVLRLSEHKSIVLDEVDRMLDMGFVHDITKIVSALPKERHSLFFSATMDERGKKIAATFLHDPLTIEIAQQRASDLVEQDVVRVNGRSKIEVLHDLLIRPGFDRVLVFGRTKHGMERLSRMLDERGFKTAAIHGNKSQNQRQRALAAFKSSQVKILLATDVAARGIDVESVTHVINYELPETYADYIHRIGRTGRAERVGVALTFID